MADPIDPETDDTGLDTGERAALGAWPAATPPAGFADRVIAARTVAAAEPPVRRRRGLAIIAAVLAAAGVAAVAIVVGTSGSTTEPGAGAVTVVERRSIRIGGRSVAVAEPGAVLAWTVGSDGTTRVEHGGGDVFYRVNGAASPFVVVTPLGEIRVTGTCFRVEVIMKPRNQKLIGGAIGAALAAAVVVTVYEGGVVIAGRGGSSKVQAGEHVVLTADGTSGPVATGPEIAAPDPTATRDQLLARDELQRQRIAGLTSRIGELERRLAEGAGAGAGNGELPESGLDHGEPWYDPSKERLAEFAKKCKVRFDVPPISDSTPFVIPADEAAADGISDAEVASMNQVFAELQRTWADRIRAIYLDVVGESNAEAGLSAQSMMREIEDKSPPGERAVLQARIAQERAGMAQPPADWTNASPIERMIRSIAAIGDEAERAIGAKLGPERARELRRKHGGWSTKAEWSGCDR